MRLRVWFSFGSFLVLALSFACTGPPGPAGPPGPPGGSSGPPFVWVCMPSHRPNFAGFQRQDLFIFNGSGVTATIAVNMLDRTGTNLVGTTIPGSSPATPYPGEAGASTASLTSGHTRNVNWPMPLTGGGGLGVDGTTNVVFAVRVTSDQPIVVGANFDAGGFLNSECNLLPK